ncbi:PEGA domain-containing protein [Patescibacteria group bacterium]|nr:PEGA domain-containing protein [Patescibacteria group bacterium]
MHKIGLIQKVITVTLLLGITTVLYLYTSGYRLEREKDNTIDIEKTGMVSAKSLPEGASVYIDGKLITATNDTIPGVKQGLHQLKIVKKGFVEWNKDIEVYEALVTDVTAILIAQSPKLEPLTTTGARNPIISPSLKYIAYFSNDNETPGIWVIPLNNGLTFFRSNPTVVMQDTKFTKYSQGNSITCSPDEKKLLIEGAEKTYYLVDLATNTAETILDPEEINLDWETKLKKKRELFLEKIIVEDDYIKETAKSDDVLWSPDEKKFLYKTEEGTKVQYKVYNMEDPLPIGEKKDNFLFEIEKTEIPPIISWYSDSFHLLLVRGDIENSKSGNISIIRIDGTNETEIYNNTLHSNYVYNAPSGDKVIILTTFKSGDQTDLYTISIR